MSVSVDTIRLRLEMTRRGWAATDLARASRLSHATISTALAGRPVAERSLALIAKALSQTPAIDIVDSLILAPHKSDRTLD
jgi:transcriptional regulator with XRE-family HTH domain